MELAAQQNLTPGETISDKLRNLENWGFNAIELNCPAVIDCVKEIGIAIADSPVKARSMCCSAKHDLAVLGDDPTARLQLNLNTLDMAADLGVETLVSVPVRSPLPKNVTTIEELSTYAGSLEILAIEAAGRNIQIGIEPLIRYETHLLNTLAGAVEIAKRVAHPSIKIVADFFHMNVEETDMEATLKDFNDWIGLVHLSDSNRLNPGRGHLNLRSCIQTLKHSGYDGVLALDCRIKGNPLEELRHYADLIRRPWN